MTNNSVDAATTYAYYLTGDGLLQMQPQLILGLQQ